MMLVVLMACGEKLPETEYEYYEASSLIVLEESGMEFEETYIVRRTLDHEASEIFEEFISTIDGTEIFVTLQVNTEDKTFALEFSDASYTGTGTFVGEGLDWSAWSSQSNHVDGTYVLSQDSKDANGITTEKEGYSADSVLEWRLFEELVPISQEAFEQARADVLP